MLTVLVTLGFALAALPAAMTALNLIALAKPPLPDDNPRVAILIPARDEERAIGACLDAALASVHADVEVLVLDDGSTDGTAALVEARSRTDPRVRLAHAPPLPTGWNGKQHACHVLSQLTDRPLMLFVDADVRLAPEGAARLANALGLARADMVSGVPRQLMGSFAERLLIPMINALLLGYLPAPAMRRFRHEALGAACGQMIMVRRSGYLAAGGHAAIRCSLHDGLKLPRAFRKAGLRTDLVDGTGLASCRMYGNGRDLVRGLLKNATEGMARPVALPTWTALLFGGHVLPWILLPISLATGSGRVVAMNAAACAAPIAARLLQARRRREPLGAVALHPFGVATLLVIQWIALARHLRGRETSWRGRAYRTQL